MWRLWREEVKEFRRRQQIRKIKKFVDSYLIYNNKKVSTYINYNPSWMHSEVIRRMIKDERTTNKIKWLEEIETEYNDFLKLQKWKH